MRDRLPCTIVVVFDNLIKRRKPRRSCPTQAHSRTGGDDGEGSVCGRACRGCSSLSDPLVAQYSHSHSTHRCAEGEASARRALDHSPLNGCAGVVGCAGWSAGAESLAVSNGIMEKAMVRAAALEADGHVREAAEVMAAAMESMMEEQQLGGRRFTEDTDI